MPVALLAISKPLAGASVAYTKLILFGMILSAGLAIMGCGGSSGGDSLPSKMLSWQPPSSYSDGTPLNPSTDLDSYEIYVKENGIFSETDNEMAAVSATNGVNGQVNTSFNLANLAPFIETGITYRVSVRTVAKNGMKSDFSPSASFSF